MDTIAQARNKPHEICRKGLHSMANAYVNPKTGERQCRECKGANMQRWRRDNVDHVLAEVRKWQMSHPEYTHRMSRQGCQTYRARKLNQFIEHVDHQVVYQMHGGMCGICEEFIEGSFEVDHVIPLSKGGMHGYINVQPAHRSCNRRKSAKVL